MGELVVVEKWLVDAVVLSGTGLDVILRESCCRWRTLGALGVRLDFLEANGRERVDNIR